MRLKYKLEGAVIPDKSKNDCEYSLHVLNYFGTSFLECMAADIPVICFFAINYLDFTTQAQQFIRELEEVGIIHKEGKSAAYKTNEIYHDIEGWWQSDLIQDVRRRFVWNYARLEPNWIESWCEEFSNI